MSIAEFLGLISIGTLETFYMTFAATILSYVFGLPLGVMLIVTEEGGLKPTPVLNKVLNFIVNIVRSVPFMIMMVALIPVTTFIVGKAIGTTAIIVPLVISATPLIARVTQATLSDVDGGVIEAAKSQGASPFQIVTRVMLPECKPSLILDVAISTTTILGYSAMAGILGGGGLGDIAIRFGLYRYEEQIMLATVVLLIIIVQVIEAIGRNAANRADKRKR